MKNQYSIFEISHCLKVNEPMTRKLLNDAGAHLDELANNPDELVNREAVIDLIVDRHGQRESILLAELIR
jgi:hypothetical protein